MLTCFIVVPDIAIAQAEPAQISGAGALACSQYTLAATEKDPVAFAYFEWAQGLLTALNLTRDSEHKTTRILMDPHHAVKAQAAFLLSYCEHQPNAKFISAALTLYVALPLSKR